MFLAIARNREMNSPLRRFPTQWLILRRYNDAGVIPCGFAHRPTVALTGWPELCFAAWSG
jgi:hypothetical protein